MPLKDLVSRSKFTRNKIPLIFVQNICSNNRCRNENELWCSRKMNKQKYFLEETENNILGCNAMLVMTTFIRDFYIKEPMITRTHHNSLNITSFQVVCIATQNPRRYAETDNHTTRRASHLEQLSQRHSVCHIVSGC